MNDRTPDEVYYNSFEKPAQMISDEAVLKVLFGSRRECKVSNSGVKVCGLHFVSEELIDLFDRKVIVQYDPEDLSKVYVYTEDGKFYCQAQSKRKSPFRNASEYDFRSTSNYNKRINKNLKEAEPKRFKDISDLMFEKIAEEHRYQIEQTEEFENEHTKEVKEAVSEREKERFDPYSEMYDISKKKGVIRGDSGAGKTTALKMYVEQNAGVIFVTANASTKSAASILSKIAVAAGRHPNGNKKFLMETLVSYLKDTKRLIIIDEADHLTLNALQAVRNLNDEANVGIVLSGNNKLYNQMVSGVRGYEFDQIRTRILLKPKVLNDYTLDEIAHIFPECDEKVIAILRKEATAESLREAIKLYNFCLTFASSHGMKLTESVMLKLMKTM